MTIPLDARVLFLLFCLVQGTTTSVLLLLSARRHPANRYLGLLLAGLTLQTLDSFLNDAGLYARNNALYFSPIFFSWSYGPLLFLYVRTLAAGRDEFRRADGFHFAPVGIQFLFFVVLSAQSLDTKTAFWMQVHKPLTRYVEYYVTIALVLGYLARSLRLLRTTPTPPGWLKPFLLGLGAFYGGTMFYPMFSTLFLPPKAPKFYLTGQVLPVFAYGLGLVGYFRQRAAPVPVAKPRARPEPEPDLLERLRQAMIQDGLFRNPTLTLADLAAHVGGSAATVSASLNAGLRQSFPEFVNGYRVADVQHRLGTPDVERLTILGIAYEAGFNSKTTFNRVFKEVTGVSPKEYQKSLAFRV
jgi:AraC-like DNA-binding protein